MAEASDRSTEANPRARASPVRWEVRVSAEDVRTLTLDELVDSWRTGLVTGEAPCRGGGTQEWGKVREIGAVRARMDSKGRRASPVLVPDTPRALRAEEGEGTPPPAGVPAEGTSASRPGPVEATPSPRSPRSRSRPPAPMVRGVRRETPLSDALLGYVAAYVEEVAVADSHPEPVLEPVAGEGSSSGTQRASISLAPTTILAPRRGTNAAPSAVYAGILGASVALLIGGLWFVAGRRSTVVTPRQRSQVLGGRVSQRAASGEASPGMPLAPRPRASGAEEPRPSPGAPRVVPAPAAPTDPATAVLRAIASAARCARQGGPSGEGTIDVVLNPTTGRPSFVRIDDRFAGTEVGGCVVARLAAVRVSPFEGEPWRRSLAFRVGDPTPPTPAGDRGLEPPPVSADSPMTR